MQNTSIKQMRRLRYNCTIHISILSFILFSAVCHVKNMLKTEQLARYLEQYKQLRIHHSAEVKTLTWQVATWQKQRMQQVHGNLFQSNTYTELADFFHSELYNFDALTELAEQLELMLAQKVKLDRWLPNEILNALVQSMQLALLTIKLDQQLAIQLIQKEQPLNHENLLHIALTCNQRPDRLRQLKLFQSVSQQLARHAQSLLLRTSLKLAKSKLKQRGFAPMYQYLDHGFQVMRSNPHAKQFFYHYAQQEHCFLDYMVNAQPSNLDVYYDQTSQQICRNAQTPPQ